jgi:hypothetical protein
VGGVNTQSVELTIESDIDAHCAHARGAGATILQEPGDQSYGARTYRTADLRDTSGRSPSTFVTSLSKSLSAPAAAKSPVSYENRGSFINQSAKRL